jgi:hypothetical protein
VKESPVLRDEDKARIEAEERYRAEVREKLAAGPAEKPNSAPQRAPYSANESAPFRPLGLSPRAWILLGFVVIAFVITRVFPVGQARTFSMADFAARCEREVQTRIKSRWPWPVTLPDPAGPSGVQRTKDGGFIWASNAEGQGIGADTYSRTFLCGAEKNGANFQVELL